MSRGPPGLRRAALVAGRRRTLRTTSRSAGRDSSFLAMEQFGAPLRPSARAESAARRPCPLVGRWSPRRRPPNRTCDFHRIRLSMSTSRGCPLGAACAGSEVPAPAPDRRRATARRCSPATSFHAMRGVLLARHGVASPVRGVDLGHRGRDGSRSGRQVRRLPLGSLAGADRHVDRERQKPRQGLAHGSSSRAGAAGSPPPPGSVRYFG
jgi:hypothetical protein